MAFKTSCITCVMLTTVSLLFLFPSPRGTSETTPAAIHVEMDHGKPLILRVELRSGSNTPATLYRSRLPWGSVYSMILIAVTSSGKELRKELPIDDPSPESVTINPKELIKGEIQLSAIFIGLDEALRKSDIQLFWAYEAPGELHIAPAGGWILIPQRR